MTESDRFYIERCLDGHPDDFRHLVRRYQSTLIAGLTYKLKNRDRAEDTVQETFVRAYFNLSKLKKPDSFLPWLMSIANSVAGEYRRKDKIFLRQDDVSSVSHITVSAERPLDIDLDRVISALPDAYRNIILLRYYGGQSCKQVAGLLEIPLGTVTKMLSRAHAMLRKSLERDRKKNQEVHYELQGM
jgi:RNA polymerase sigma-70 factor, ECF subfamily